ncbi:DUF3363 domain-containing protein [uncultured Rhodospira sp.]|uniref:DUF3363 domain-containing protein n=1 Tax=uncultured Rhodospira sp. TaxID=1936189 RepID=UPI00263098F9|nr:DUF3363 domain-containing protein [uncultured Rhodospira sp.]
MAAAINRTGAPIAALISRDCNGVACEGERGDIIMAPNRPRDERDRAPDSGKIVLQYLGALATHAVGWVVTRGLSCEIRHRQYLIVDGPGGRTHCVDIGQCEGEERTPEGAIVDVSSLAVRSS